MSKTLLQKLVTLRKNKTRTAVRSVRSLPALLLEKMRWEKEMGVGDLEMEIGRWKRLGDGREREKEESGRWKRVGHKARENCASEMESVSS